MKFYWIVLTFCFVTGMSACKKVIEIDLNENEPKYVIEGIITDQPGECIVTISRSRHFNDPNHFEMISGALVKVSDNGSETTLNETSPGVYQSNSINGTPGHHYQLTVTVNGKTFIAASTMPQPVLLDTLYIDSGPFGQFKFPVIAYTDPAGTNNGYRFIQYVNGVKDPAIFWEDDEFTDGQQVIKLLDNGVDRQNDPRVIRSGDVVKIEMLTIDEAVLKYWYTLRTNGGTGQGSVAAPSNPVTNIQGGALGYFSAHTINSRTVIAP